MCIVSSGDCLISIGPPHLPIYNDHQHKFTPSTNLQEDILQGPHPCIGTLNIPFFHSHKHKLHDIVGGPTFFSVVNPCLWHIPIFNNHPHHCSRGGSSTKIIPLHLYLHIHKLHIKQIRYHHVDYPTATWVAFDSEHLSYVTYSPLSSYNYVLWSYVYLPSLDSPLTVPDVF